MLQSHCTCGGLLHDFSLTQLHSMQGSLPHGTVLLKPDP